MFTFLFHVFSRHEVAICPFESMPVLRIFPSLPFPSYSVSNIHQAQPTPNCSPPTDLCSELQPRCQFISQNIIRMRENSEASRGNLCHHMGKKTNSIPTTPKVGIEPTPLELSGSSTSWMDAVSPDIFGPLHFLKTNPPNIIADFDLILQGSCLTEHRDAGSSVRYSQIKAG